MLTTSIGEPMQTAKKPAAKPASRWVKTLSLKNGIFIIVCICMEVLEQTKTKQPPVESKETYTQQNSWERNITSFIWS